MLWCEEPPDFEAPAWDAWVDEAPPATTPAETTAAIPQPAWLQPEHQLWNFQEMQLPAPGCFQQWAPSFKQQHPHDDRQVTATEAMAEAVAKGLVLTGAGGVPQAQVPPLPPGLLAEVLPVGGSQLLTPYIFFFM